MFKDNPSTQNRFSYKYDLLWALKLSKLDYKVVVQKDYDLSKAFNLKNIRNDNNFDKN